MRKIAPAMQKGSSNQKKKLSINIKPSTRYPGKVISEEAETTSDGEEADMKEEKKGAEMFQK